MDQFDPIIGLVMAAIATSLIGFGLYGKFRLRQLDRQLEELKAAQRADGPSSTAR